MNLTFPPSPHCQTRGLEPPPGSLRKIFDIWSELNSGVWTLSLRQSDTTWAWRWSRSNLFDSYIWPFLSSLHNQTSSFEIWPMVVQSLGPAGHSSPMGEERPPNQTKFAKLIPTLTKNKSHRREEQGPFSQPLSGPGWSGQGVKFISLIKVKLRVSTRPWKLYIPTQQNHLQVWLTDWSSSYYRIWPYLLISIYVIATFANLFSLKNFNWLSWCL